MQLLKACDLQNKVSRGRRCAGLTSQGVSGQGKADKSLSLSFYPYINLLIFLLLILRACKQISHFLETQFQARPARNVMTLMQIQMLVSGGLKRKLRLTFCYLLGFLVSTSDT